MIPRFQLWNLLVHLLELAICPNVVSRVAQTKPCQKMLARTGLLASFRGMASAPSLARNASSRISSGSGEWKRWNGGGSGGSSGSSSGKRSGGTALVLGGALLAASSRWMTPLEAACEGETAAAVPPLDASAPPLRAKADLYSGLAIEQVHCIQKAT